MTRKEFVGAAIAFSAFPGTANDACEHGLRVRFLGTGAADWNGPDPKLGFRRLTSVLLDGRVLVDCTRSNLDMLPVGCRPETVFYTHSHADHYDADVLVELGVRCAYCHSSWAKELRTELEVAARRTGIRPPEVRPLEFGEKVMVEGICLTSLPANHKTSRIGERCSMYLIEKNETRLLYATDTSGIPAEAAWLAGIDAHVNSGKPISALIMEATMGVEYTDDWRLFEHSSVATVAQVVRVLTATGRYCPRRYDQKVYLTHMAKTLHGTHKDVASSVPSPLAPASDGLEVVL